MCDLDCDLEQWTTTTEDASRRRRKTRAVTSDEIRATIIDQLSSWHDRRKQMTLQNYDCWSMKVTIQRRFPVNHASETLPYSATLHLYGAVLGETCQGQRERIA